MEEAWTEQMDGLVDTYLSWQRSAPRADPPPFFEPPSPPINPPPLPPNPRPTSPFPASHLDDPMEHPSLPSHPNHIPPSPELRPIPSLASINSQPLPDTYWTLKDVWTLFGKFDVIFEKEYPDVYLILQNDERGAPFHTRQALSPPANTSFMPDTSPMPPRTRNLLSPSSPLRYTG